jgi:hypothetical protein
MSLAVYQFIWGSDRLAGAAADVLIVVHPAPVNQ